MGEAGLDASAIRTIMTQTFVHSIRSKWLLAMGAIFFALASSVTLLNFFADGFDLALVQQLCDSFCPPDLVAQYLAGFIAAVYPYIPLLTLPMGAALIAEEREQGTLQYIMSNPISKTDYLIGRMTGMLLATTLVVVLGFAVATVYVFGGNLAKYPGFAIATAAGVLLNGIMLFLSLIISALTRHKVTAIAGSVVLWLLFAVVGNATNLSSYLNLKGGPLASLPAMVLNPIDASQNWATLLLGNDITQSTTTGLIITFIFKENTSLVLAGTLFAWLGVCFAGAFLLFRYQDVV